MLNAIVSTKENSAVIEFPLDLYELYHQLNQIGITQGPHRIKIIDDDNAAVRVKLCSESDFGNHVIRLINEKDTLEDLHTVVGAINIAPNEVKHVFAIRVDNISEQLITAVRIPLHHGKNLCEKYLACNLTWSAFPLGLVTPFERISCTFLAGTKCEDLPFTVNKHLHVVGMGKL